MIIPTRGRPDLLHEALQSVLGQSVMPEEIIVSDNHGDPSARLALEDSGLISQVRLVSPPEPMPIDAHWIWALKQGVSDWVAFLEDDNLWRPRHLEALQEAIAVHPSAGVVAASAIYFSDEEHILNRTPHCANLKVDLLSQKPVSLTARESLAVFIFGTTPASSAVAVRRATIEKVKPEPIGITGPQDQWLWAQLVASDGMAVVPTNTVLYREHDSQLTQSLARETYRAEIRSYFMRVCELAKTNGWTLKELNQHACEVLSLNHGSRFLVDIARTRSWKLWESLAGFYGKHGFKSWILTLARFRLLGNYPQ
ncbi:MAG: glycosyltransferase family A protein [Cyanobacteria bacterium J06656_5]